MRAATGSCEQENAFAPTLSLRARSWHIALILTTSVAIVLACLRIASTYGVFTQTYDEPFHIACGLEWLAKGHYDFETQHPPLARVAAAIGPYLAGARDIPAGHPVEVGNSVLLDHGPYFLQLALARCGSLLFFVLACVFVILLTTKAFGHASAVLAVCLFALLPPILGHAGLATTDMALTATLVMTCYYVLNWLERRTARHAAIAGAAAALAVLSKFTAVPFLAVLVLVFAGVYLWRSSTIRARVEYVNVARSLLAGSVAAGLVLWAGYRFSVGPLREASEPERQKSAVAAAPQTTLRTLAMQVPVPAPNLLKGLVAAYGHAAKGHPSYLFDEYRRTGWWYFFPVVLAVKTPVAFLVLWGIGLVAVAHRVAGWRGFAIGAGSLALLLSVLPSRVNLGVRHILPIYTLMAPIAAYAVITLWRNRKGRVVGPVVAAILIIWCVQSSIAAHPDYLAYFNELGGNHPESILAESDLDWGQDLGRLGTRLDQLGVGQCWIAYFGSADLNRFSRAKLTPLSEHEPVKGWIAVSIRMLTVEKAEALRNGKKPPYDWLLSQSPIERIGKTILLYHIR